MTPLDGEEVVLCRNGFAESDCAHPCAECGEEVTPPFVVVETWTEKVVRYVPRRKVLLRTDDGLEAEQARIDHAETIRRKAHGRPDPSWKVVIEGFHPSHQESDGRCVTCDVPLLNGCWGSHLPCGYDSGGHSLMSLLARRRADDETAATDRPNEQVYGDIVGGDSG